MKLAQKLQQVCEQLDNAQLSKFWEEAKKHLLTASDESIKNESLLVGTESFDAEDVTVSDYIRDDQNKIVDDLEKSLEVSADVWYLKDLVASVLNDYVLQDRASTEEEDKEALQFLLKKIKNETIGFNGRVLVQYFNEKKDQHEGEEHYLIRGTGKIEDMRYDESKDILFIERFEIKNISQADVE